MDKKTLRGIVIVAVVCTVLGITSGILTSIKGLSIFLILAGIYGMVTDRAILGTSFLVKLAREDANTRWESFQKITIVGCILLAISTGAAKWAS